MTYAHIMLLISRGVTIISNSNDIVRINVEFERLKFYFIWTICLSMCVAPVFEYLPTFQLVLLHSCSMGVLL